jgi:hypothetical protein
MELGESTGVLVVEGIPMRKESPKCTRSFMRRNSAKNLIECNPCIRILHRTHPFETSIEWCNCDAYRPYFDS